MRQKALGHDVIASALQSPLTREFVENNVNEFFITALPEDVLESDEAYYWYVTITRKSPGRWAVSDRFGRNQYNIKGESERESLPSSRTEKFIEEFRHDLDTAVELAFQIAPKITTNGLNAEKFADWYREKVAKGDKQN